MGGLGSGNRYRRKPRKRTVEESLELSIQYIRKRIDAGGFDTITWTWTSGRKSEIGCLVTKNNDSPMVALQYCWCDTENVSMIGRLVPTPTQFGGRRWWFTCPLIVNGMACRRRVGKLYLPPGKKYFGCRKCYNLTYQSCQEAHEDERQEARMERWERKYRKPPSR
jgi:hypothetical protein